MLYELYLVIMQYYIEMRYGVLNLNCNICNNIINVYITIFSLTQLYLPFVVEYNNTCFGPLCGPSSGVT